MTSTVANTFAFREKTVVYLFVLLNLLMSTEYGFFPAALMQIREYLGVSYTKGGILGSINFLGYCISSPFFGYMANSLPPVKMTWVGILLYVGSLLGISISSNYWLILGFRLIQSFGQSAVGSVAPVIVDLVAEPNRRAMWNAVFMGNAYLGFPIGQIIGGIILDYTWVWFPQDESWRIVFIFQAVLTAILAPSFLIMKGPDNILSVVPDEEVEDNDTVIQKTMVILNNRTYLFCCIGNSVLIFLLTGSAFYLIEFMQDVFLITAMKAGTIVGILLGATVIFGIVCGGIILDYAIKFRSKRFEHTCSLMEMSEIATKLTCITLTIAAASAPFLAFRPFTDQLYIFCTFFAFVMLAICIAIGPINNTILWSVELKDRSFAKALSIVSSYIFGRIPAPTIFGFLKETWGWSWAFFCMGCNVSVILITIGIAHYHAKSAVNMEMLKIQMHGC